MLYQRARSMHRVVMTSHLLTRQDGRVQETKWARLRQTVDRRAKRLGLSQPGIQARGGPSPAWVNKLGREQGAPTTRNAIQLNKLDAALGWPSGTSLAFLTTDLPRDAWDDWEDARVEQGDEISMFAGAVDEHLRSVDEKERGELMAIIGRLIGYPIGGDL